MIPMTIGAWLVVLAFPFIIVAALAWPFFVVRRYRAIRRGARPQQATEHFKRQTLVGGAICYAVLLTAMFAPKVSPALSAFVAKGGLAGVVPLIFIDCLLGALFSEARARAAFVRAGAREELPAVRVTSRF